MPSYTPTSWYSHPGVDRGHDGNVWKCTTILIDMGICVKRSHILSTLGCSNLSRRPIEGICATVLAQSGGPQPRTQTPFGAPAPPGPRAHGGIHGGSTVEPPEVGKLRDIGRLDIRSAQITLW